ncbi:MAG: DegV family protein [Anaerolineales bacterium]
MSIRIVTDSSCDLPQELVRKHNITVIPLYINVGLQEYRDGIDLSRQEFYTRLPDFRQVPTTAAPSPEVFRLTYERLATEGASQILSIHISTRLSSVFGIASQAVREKTSLPVTVFDSRQLSLGTGFQVLAAAQAAEAGCSMQEILARLEDQITHTHVFAALDTLEFLRRSGRMNFAVAFLGGILQIKPFLKMYAGKPTAERVRTRNAAMNRLVELLEEASPLEKVAVLHSQALDRAEVLLQRVKHILPAGDTLVEEINPVLGAHIGPGVVGFACISK